MIQKNFNFQQGCLGDSGGPIIWEDKKDEKRAYLMGIISKGSTYKQTCGLVKNEFYTTIGVTVPGKVVHWVKNLKEVKKCLRDGSTYP